MTDNATIDTQSQKDTLSSDSQTQATPINPSASPSTQPPSDLPPSTSKIEPPSTDVNAQRNGPGQGKGKVKSKGKKTKARPRRRVAESDNESDAEGEASDASLSDQSSAAASDSEPDPDSESEDEEGDEEEEGAPQPDPKSKTKSDKPVFEDTNSTTPAIWSEKDKSTAPEVSFDSFNKGELPPRGDSSNTRGKGKARGGSSSAATGGAKREYTEEETKKYEELKAKRKEKQKAKRAELKESKRKERESAAGTGTAEEKKEESKKILIRGKGKKKDSEVDGITASTSELKLDDKQNEEEDNTIPLTADGSPPPPTKSQLPPQKGRRGSKSQHRDNAVNDDPKIVPRQGKFWTHDQRAEPQQNQQNQLGRDGFSGRGLPDWRGRGLPRGGFRGRGGRGFSTSFNGRFPQQGGAGQELTATEPAVDSEKEEGEGEGDEPVLAMDREEKALAKKEKQQPSTSTDTQPKEKKWGHEAFEQIQVEKERKPVPPAIPVSRGGFRGLPRGRGRGIGPRGGHFGQPFRQPLSSLPFHPANLAAAAAAAKAASASTTPAPSTAPSVSAPVPVVAASQPAPSAEEQSTQPDADELLEESSQAVTIRLPGSSATVEVAVVSPLSEPKAVLTESAPTTSESSAIATKTPELNASGQAILYTSPVPPPQPISQQPQVQQQPQPSIPSFVSAHPVPSPIYPNVSAPSPFAPGSENGSISSGGLSHSHFVPTHPQQRSHLQQNVVPTGYGMGSEFVPSSRSHHMNGNQSRPFYPSAGNGAPRSYPVHQQQQNQRPPVQPFYPQQQSYEYQPQSQRGSFSGSQPQSFYPQQAQVNGGYIDGRGSPFSTGSPGPGQYATASPGNGQMNYFVPARQSQKISIKPPSTSSNKDISSSEKDTYSTMNSSAPTFASLTSAVDSTQHQHQQQQGYYPQHYNPYNANGYTNGMDENGYYNIQSNGYQGWEGQVGYGYEGDYGY